MKKSRHTPEQVTYGHEGKIVAVAERAGFEPARSLRPYAISSRARSSTPAPLRASGASIIIGSPHTPPQVWGRTITK